VNVGTYFEEEHTNLIFHLVGKRTREKDEQWKEVLRLFSSDSCS